MLKMSLSLWAATVLWLSFPASAAHITKTDLMLEAYVNPPGDVLDVWVYLTEKEKEASLELRAYLISGKDNEKKQQIEASDFAKKQTPENLIHFDRDGFYLNPWAKALRVDDHLRGDKPMQAHVAQTGFIIAYRDLKLPVGEHKIGFEITLIVDGKPQGEPFGTALSRVKVTQEPRKTMTFTVERELAKDEEPGPNEKLIYAPGEEPHQAKKRMVHGMTEVEVLSPIDPGVYRSKIKGWGNNGASRVKDFIIRPREEPVAAKLPKIVLPWEPQHHNRKLLFATNRNLADGKQWSNQPERFGYEASQLRAGVSFFDIPIDTHRMGVLELPSSPKNFDPQKHWGIRELFENSLDSFFKRELTERTGGYYGEDIIVFIHGYNNKLDFAQLRFMQMMYDIRFQGIPIAYLWPSAGEFKAYLDDEKKAEASWKPLADFLVQLVEAHAKLDQPGKVEPGKIHLLAHSMGNRVLLKALADVRKRLGDKKVFSIIVLAAADVDLADFNANAPSAVELSEVVYNYHNADDVALKASRGVHVAKRVGAEAIPFKGVINVDARKANATSIFTIGHDYYTSTNPLLYDFNMLFNEKKGPKERATLTEHFNEEKQITEYIFH